MRYFVPNIFTDVPYVFPFDDKVISTIDNTYPGYPIKINNVYHGNDTYLYLNKDCTKYYNPIYEETFDCFVAEVSIVGDWKAENEGRPIGGNIIKFNNHPHYGMVVEQVENSVYLINNTSPLYFVDYDYNNLYTVSEDLGREPDVTWYDEPTPEDNKYHISKAFKELIYRLGITSDQKLKLVNAIEDCCTKIRDGEDPDDPHREPVSKEVDFILDMNYEHFVGGVCTIEADKSPMPTHPDLVTYKAGVETRLYYTTKDKTSIYDVAAEGTRADLILNKGILIDITWTDDNVISVFGNTSNGAYFNDHSGIAIEGNVKNTYQVFPLAVDDNKNVIDISGFEPKIIGYYK